MKNIEKAVEIDVIDNVDKGDIGRHIHHAIELGYHVKVEPAIYEEDTDRIQYQITLLKAEGGIS